MNEYPPRPSASSQNPPPLPAPVINYAAPMAGGAGFKSKPNFPQQAAKFSWAAPLAAALIGTCLNSNQSLDPTTSMVMAGFNGLLILTGLVMGVVALLGIKRYGKEKILVPAIVGICINALIVLAMLSLLGTTMKMKKSLQARAAAARVAASITPAQYQDEAMMQQPGWVGAIMHDGAKISLVEVSSTSAMSRDVQHMSSSNAQFLILAIDNSAAESKLVVDPSQISLVGDDGATLGGCYTSAQLNSYLNASRALFGKFGLPAVVPPKAVEPATLAVFVPPGVNLRNVKQIAVNVNGENIVVPGATLSATQKQENRKQYDASRASQTQ